jgi:pimeloyl-ACP methyl ester carboxylesterase
MSDWVGYVLHAGDKKVESVSLVELVSALDGEDFFLVKTYTSINGIKINSSYIAVTQSGLLKSFVFRRSSDRRVIRLFSTAFPVPENVEKNDVLNTFDASVAFIFEHNAFSAWHWAARFFASKAQHNIPALVDGLADQVNVLFQPEANRIKTNLGFEFILSESTDGAILLGSEQIRAEQISNMEAASLYEKLSDGFALEWQESGLDQPQGDVILEAVACPVGAYTLRGTVAELVNGAKHDLILILPGSGVFDMDGRFGSFDIGYKEWAVQLAKLGFKVLRYNRIDFTKGNASAQLVALTFDDLVNQALAWLAMFMQDSKRVILVGHSLGGLLALRISALVPVDVVVTIGTPAQAIETIVAGQFQRARQALQPAASQEALSNHAAVMAYWKGQGSNTAIKPDLLRAYAQERLAIMNSLLAVSGTDLIHVSKAKHILVMHGVDDSQVRLEEADRLVSSASDKTHVALLQLPDRDHALQIPGLGDAKVVDAAQTISNNLSTFLESSAAAPL